MPTKFGFPEDAFASYDLLSYELRRRGSNSGNAYLRDRLTSLALRLPKQGITGSDMESLIDEAMQLANRQKQEVARIAIGAFGEATLATVQP